MSLLRRLEHLERPHLPAAGMQWEAWLFGAAPPAGLNETTRVALTRRAHREALRRSPCMEVIARECRRLGREPPDLEELDGIDVIELAITLAGTPTPE